MDRVEHDLSDEQWIALKDAWGGCALDGPVDLATGPSTVPVTAYCLADATHDGSLLWRG